ncbi:MAG: restriction endonuclease [Candidatus Hydrogenedentota bacterium]
MIFWILFFVIFFSIALLVPGFLSTYHAEKNYEIADEDYKRGKIPEAEARLKENVTKNPNHTRSRWLLQKIYQELGRFEDSIVQIKSVIKYNAFDNQITEYVARKELAEISERIGDPLAALEQYEYILKKFPDDIEVLSRRGEIAFNQDDKKRAMDSYKRLVELDPDNYRYQEMLGDIFFGMRQYNEALECYDRAYIANHVLEIALKLCDTLVNVNRVQDAVNIYEELITQNQGNVPNVVRYNLSLSYYKLENYTACVNQLLILIDRLTVEEVNQGIEKDALYILSDSYIKMGKNEDAKRFLKKLYHIDREYKDVAKKLKSFGDFVTDEEILLKFYNLYIYEYENYCRKIIERLGYTLRVSNIIDDSAVNIVADKKDVKTLIFIRRWKNEVGQLPLKDLHIMMVDYKCDGGLFICTSKFNRSAIEYQKHTKDMSLIDGERVAELLREVEFI